MRLQMFRVTTPTARKKPHDYYGIGHIMDTRLCVYLCLNWRISRTRCRTGLNISERRVFLTVHGPRMVERSSLAPTAVRVLLMTPKLAGGTQVYIIAGQEK